MESFIANFLWLPLVRHTGVADTMPLAYGVSERAYRQGWGLKNFANQTFYS